MIYQKIGIRTAYIEEKIVDDTSIVTVFVLWPSSMEAEYLLPNEDKSNKKYLVVNDIYKFYQRNDEIIRTDSYEVYYESKKKREDSFHVKSIKFFSSLEKGYRTDWYCNFLKKITYKTYETGADNDFDYIKFECTGIDNKFTFNSLVYNGVLSDVNLGEELLTKINDINFDYNIRKEDYKENYINQKVKVKTLSF